MDLEALNAPLKPEHRLWKVDARGASLTVYLQPGHIDGAIYPVSAGWWADLHFKTTNATEDRISTRHPDAAAAAAAMADHLAEAYARLGL